MSRKIKFRAWDVKEKLMRFDAQNQYDYLCSGWATNFGEVLEDDNYIVMQYTGLKDKNDKEIYEGDILEDKSGLVGFVIWCNSCLSYQMNYSTEVNYCHHCGGDFQLTELEKIQVIGNIHENPEILN